MDTWLETLVAQTSFDGAPHFLTINSGVQVMAKHYPRGLDGRMRDQNGEIRKKRSDTLVRTLRDEYGENFAAGYRSDAKLGTVLKREGVETLDQFLKKP